MYISAANYKPTNASLTNNNQHNVYQIQIWNMNTE